MKDLLLTFGKQGRKVLLVGMLTSGLTACGGFIDPTMSHLPTYEMPAAVVIQTPPVGLQGQMRGYGDVQMNAMPHYSPQGQFAQPTGGTAPTNGYNAQPSYGTPQTMSRADGSTVIQQAPITLQRPAIVVPQQPIWVGNPPMPIPQPPVVINQPPITYEQPSVVVRPPQIEFGMPVRSTFAPQAQVMAPPPVTSMPIQPQHQNGYQYQQQPPPIQYQQQEPMQYQQQQPMQYQQQQPMQYQQQVLAPPGMAPSQQVREDYLPPK